MNTAAADAIFFSILFLKQAESDAELDALMTADARYLIVFLYIDRGEMLMTYVELLFLADVENLTLCGSRNKPITVIK